ncbi:Serine/threonine-protein phosphatase 7 long form [Glycine soja]
MKTHTFHFPHGEATITLQDVALQLGLKIDGLLVTGFITGDVRVAFQTLLGKTPPNKYVKVLASLFQALDRAVKSDQTKIGGCLLLLQSWSWDRIKCITPKIDHLSMEEVQEGLEFPLARRWSRPRIEPNIPTNSMRLIRIIFDKLHINETPYDTPEIRSLINDVEVSMIVRAKVPLICFAIVE